MCWTLVSFDLLIPRQSVGYLSIHCLLLICLYCLPICSLFGDIIPGYRYAVCQYVSCAWSCLQFIFWSPLALLMIPRQFVGCMSILWHLVGLLVLSVHSADLLMVYRCVSYRSASSVNRLVVRRSWIGSRYADIINIIGDCVSMCWWAMWWSPSRIKWRKNYLQRL